MVKRPVSIRYAQNADITRGNRSQKARKKKNPAKRDLVPRDRKAMKTPHDPRHRKRQRIVEDLFRMSFHKQPISILAREVLRHKDVIDQYVARSAQEFPIEKINKTDLAILRLAVYELLIENKAPINVIIDEAVELAKEYGGETSPGFINGALGSILRYEKSSKIQK